MGTSFTIVGLADATGDLVKLNAAMKTEMWMAADDLSRKCQDIYEELAPKRTGAFAASMRGTSTKTNEGFLVQVGTNMAQLEMWLREGTGLYGPLRHRIYPVRAQAMGPVYDWPSVGSGPLWFASIAGMHSNPWEIKAAARSLAAVDVESTMLASGLDLALK